MNLFYIPSYVDREAKRKFKSYNCLIYPIISISIAYKCQILSFRREEITIKVHALALCYDDSHIQIKFMIESKAFILIKWCIQWYCHGWKGTMSSDSFRGVIDQWWELSSYERSFYGCSFQGSMYTSCSIDMSMRVFTVWTVSLNDRGFPLITGFLWYLKEEWRFFIISSNEWKSISMTFMF